MVEWRPSLWPPLHFHLCLRSLMGWEVVEGVGLVLLRLQVPPWAGRPPLRTLLSQLHPQGYSLQSPLLTGVQLVC